VKGGSAEGNRWQPSCSAQIRRVRKFAGLKTKKAGVAKHKRVRRIRRKAGRGAELEEAVKPKLTNEESQARDADAVCEPNLEAKKSDSNSSDSVKDTKREILEKGSGGKSY